MLAFALVGLLFAGNAAAQDWFGVRSGYPLGVTLHYGVGNALGNGADLRISGRLVASSGGVRFGLAADALLNVFVDGPIDAYVGAGPSIEFGPGRADLGVQGLVGGQFRFAQVGLPQLGVFAEGSVGASLSLSGGSARIPTFGAALGFNWFF
ncbi:MAG: hypothetical protein EA416_09235 [Trueperaceae bacterium]|nr:MAG: hypothetical protein EA416_09235 [Trueperaceae bacterium]